MKCLSPFFLLFVFPAFVSAADKPLWNTDELFQPPAAVNWIDEEGPIRRLTYSGEPYQGKPTSVFAYCAFPELKEGEQAPGIVLIHGGGGTAFREWAEIWRKRGYVAIAMDLAGKGEDRKPLPGGGPAQGDNQKFPAEPIPLTDVWSYHAVANCLRAHSLIRSFPEVDPERTAATGISWGGYLTCIVSGLDDRFKATVPVYGCGFLQENSAWLRQLNEKMSPEWSKTWSQKFDPSQYVGKAKMPMLFVSGTNDFPYPLDSYRKTYRLVKDHQLCVTVRMPHGHPSGWAPNEIDIFIDSVLNSTPPLPEISLDVRLSEDKMTATAVTCEKSGKAEFHWTTDTGPWPERIWQSQEVELKAGTIGATLPEGRPLVGFFTLTDDRGATVSTEHFVVE